MKYIILLPNIKLSHNTNRKNMKSGDGRQKKCLISINILDIQTKLLKEQTGEVR